MALRVLTSARFWAADLLVTLVCLGATVSVTYWIRRDVHHRVEDQFESDAESRVSLLEDALRQRLAAVSDLSRSPGGTAGTTRGGLPVQPPPPGPGLGFDPAVVPACREAMCRAAETGLPAATEAFLPPAGGDTAALVCVFQPSWRDGSSLGGSPPPALCTTTLSYPDRSGLPDGQTLAVLAFGPDTLLTRALAPLSANDLLVALEDLDGAEGRQILAVAGAVSSDRIQAMLQEASQSRLFVEHPLDFGGRRWRLRIAAPPDYLAAQALTGIWWIPILGLLFTALIVSYLRVLRAQRAQDQGLVRTRTEELAASEAMLRAITGSARDAIVMMDPRGLVSFWNPAAEATFGWTASEMLGRPLHDFIAAETLRHRFRDAYPAFWATGNGPAVGQTLELPARCRDGAEITVELSISAVSLDGEWHAVGVLRDVTERVRARQDLDRAYEQAAAMNRDLESAIARANEMALSAELANTAKSSFLANMSHEIRTPMNGVIGMTGLLLETELTPVQRDYVETVRGCGEGLLTLINDILDFSKIEAGRLELEALEFDLRASLEELSDLLAVKAHEKGLVFICRVEPEVPSRLRGDPGRLRQVLTNLIGNAIKFTTRGEVSLRISLQESDADSVRLHFEVRDTGIGIPEDRLGGLFHPFAQVDRSTSRLFGGTGLGLSISKKLAERMGGTIGVTSKESRGSTFWFTAVLGRQATSGLSGWEPVPELHGRRVLVTDSNASSRRLLTDLLRFWGCDPAETADPSQALESLRDAAAAGRPFEVALLDRRLGDGEVRADGEALAREIRRDPSLSATKLVCMTFIGEPGSQELLLDPGIAATVTRPVKPAQFAQVLQDVLGVNVAPASPERDSGPAKPDSTQDWKRGVRILIAEDNPVNQKVALRILEKLGFRAEAVANGREAIQALTNTSYDLVLMDCQMPEMDGYEATEIIRDPSSPVRNHSIPVIALTAHAMAGDQVKCLESGMCDYVAKPVRPQELASAIERWVGVEATQAPAGNRQSSDEGPADALAA